MLILFQKALKRVGGGGGSEPTPSERSDFCFAVPTLVVVTSPDSVVTPRNCNSEALSLVAVPFTFLVLSLLLSIGTSILALIDLNDKFFTEKKNNQ